MGLRGIDPPMVTGGFTTAFGGSGGWNDPSMFLLFEWKRFRRLLVDQNRLCWLVEGRDMSC